MVQDSGKGRIIHKTMRVLQRGIQDLGRFRVCFCCLCVCCVFHLVEFIFS